MAYDTELAERIRELVATEIIVEKAMFGGLAFLVNGNMSVAASGQGGLLVRVDPTEAADLIGDRAEPMVMRGREMTGWLHVVVDSDEELAEWVRRGVDYAKSLPPKKGR
ncbi:MAG TPA: TfoX/Sxy family protein [Kutzneria sp.]|nr:TfoX/Sxy family protein [Kutzneria sp.]